MIPLVDLKRQYNSIKSEVDTAIHDVIESTSFINGSCVKKFENDFASLHGARYAIGTSSGTSALHLALKALGIGLGDEVITVPNTFIATTEAISQTCARVRFVDIDPKTFNIDVNNIEQAITEKTKAIIPVFLYGQPCDMKMIMALAKKFDLKVIVDAAQAHLAQIEGEPIGHFADVNIFSFYPGKNLGAYGDAGLAMTNDEALANRMRMLANHGRNDKYEHLMEGFNYRMDEIQAAVLNVKLKYLLRWTRRRQEIAQLYNRLLKDADVITPVSDHRFRHVYHLYVLRCALRNKVVEKLKDRGITTGIHYPIPLHLQKAYQYLGYIRGRFPVTEQLSEEIFSLPMYPELSDEEVEFIASWLLAALKKEPHRVFQHV